ncbi:hypothetical protein [Bradyrhizobium sp. CCBAU 45394]|uniref:hypothetical protein n=1 Tax=Bradyrhizobium sp. CCBAU 45394 TaxID=1325087 RepID=UPI0023024FD3|nr:hypothetical protein [Bradyrhizobium sp. CCBAU 45394]
MQQMAGDGETVTPSLPKPDVWTGTARADVSGPLRWKRAKTIEARGGDVVQPHQEAGYTSAVVTVDPDQAGRCNRAGLISSSATWSWRLRVNDRVLPSRTLAFRSQINRYMSHALNPFIKRSNARISIWN